MDCADCLGLVERSATLEPHAALRPLSGRRVGQGWNELYKCGTCGMVLQRLAMPPGAPTREVWVRKAGTP